MPETQDLLNQAIIEHKAGRLAEASKIYQKVINQDPRNYDAIRLLGIMASQTNEVAMAVDLLESAIKLQPQQLEAHIDLSRTLFKPSSSNQQYFDRLIECYEKILEIDPNNLEALEGIASQLKKDSRTHEAYPYNLKLTELDPSNMRYLHDLGAVLNSIGKIDEAKAIFRRVLDQDPGRALTLYSLMVHCTLDKDELKALLGKAEEVYKQSESQEDKNCLGFAIARTYEQLGDYDQAFHYFREANEIHKALIPYNIDNDKLFFSNIQTAFTQEYFKQNFVQEQRSTTTPIFIVGMPRSGTTLVEQILASHPEIHGAGELYHIFRLVLGSMPVTNTILPRRIHNYNQEFYRDLGNQYLDMVQELSPQSKYITDKMPSNFIHLGAMKLMLPHAKIIHCTRDPIDTCLSCFKQFFVRSHYYTRSLEEQAEYYRLYQGMMKHWHQVLPEGSIYEINYENLIANQEQESKKLIDYCGLDWHEDCLNFHTNERVIETASRTQVRQPIYKTSIKLWQKYEKHLGPLLTLGH